MPCVCMLSHPLTELPLSLPVLRGQATDLEIWSPPDTYWPELATTATQTHLRPSFLHLSQATGKTQGALVTHVGPDYVTLCTALCCCFI